jgi:hypothetical protein
MNTYSTHLRPSHHRRSEREWAPRHLAQEKQ